MKSGLFWAEKTNITATSGLRTATQGLAGFPVAGMVWATGQNCTETLAETLALSLPFTATLRAGVTCPNRGILVVRAVAQKIEPLRELMIRCWTFLRPAIHGRQPDPFTFMERLTNLVGRGSGTAQSLREGIRFGTTACHARLKNAPSRGPGCDQAIWWLQVSSFVTVLGSHTGGTSSAHGSAAVSLSKPTDGKRTIAPRILSGLLEPRPTKFAAS